MVRVGGGVARIHYTGYDAQFDEEVALDNQRLRPFGQIRSEKLKERKENFVLQMDAGCCPGGGVKLQCTDKMALGQALAVPNMSSGQNRWITGTLYVSEGLRGIQPMHMHTYPHEILATAQRQIFYFSF